jgi:hypothetical protein
MDYFKASGTFPMAGIFSRASAGSSLPPALAGGVGMIGLSGKRALARLLDAGFSHLWVAGA